MATVIREDSVNETSMKSNGSVRKTLLGAFAFAAVLASSAAASAQEIQLTGPLAGAPAVRKLRLHREGRFEMAPSVSFTLLDEYQRTIMPGLRATYHPYDWLGIGVWGGYGFQYSTALTDELQAKAVDARNCDANPSNKECRRTEINITRKSNGTGQLADDQFGKMEWIAAPQVTVIPFRGKLALFAELFVDTDVSFFAGPAIIGLKERADCGGDKPTCATNFKQDSRLAIAPTFGLGLNFYPSSFIGFGTEWRALPFSWNTSGFDNAGTGTDDEFPDTKIDDNDRQFHFNNMITLYLTVQLPTKIRTTD